MSHFLSYRDQTRHYFNRAHTSLPEGKISGEAAWAGKDLRETTDWIEIFTKEDIAEIEAAIQHAKEKSVPTEELTREDFPLANLVEKFARWRKEIKSGRGFQVIRGLPVGRWSQEDAELFFWCFGLHLGRPGAQNAKGDLLGHVTDTGAAKEDPLSRLYATAANIDYHCDGADVVGLLCLNKAKSGGQSRIVSSVTVFNELYERRPELAKKLFEARPLDIRNEAKEGGRKFIQVTPCTHAEGELKTFYHADYFRSVVRHEEIGAFDAQEQELLDLYEEIAADPDLLMDMDLEPGDIQLLSNHTNLHARTDYVDHEDPQKKRHLLRLWLSLD
ncbi:MAG: TauD/TfdA family dioxygenase [Sneathiellales bacterium]|nr:TauD/TfdA family dioxygenase [Sneathiellales bacterium]